MMISMPQRRFLAVIHFLREQARPARMSFDHDPRWGGGGSRMGFSLRVAALPDGGWGGNALVSPAAATNERLCREVSPQLQV